MLITVRVDIEVEPTEAEIAAMRDEGTPIGQFMIPGGALFTWGCEEAAMMRLSAVPGVRYTEVGD